MNDDIKYRISINLDRNTTEEQRKLARQVFDVEEVGIRGRYALEADKIIEITQDLIVNLGGSAIWAGLMWAAVHAKKYISDKAFPPNTTAIGIYRAASPSLTWEIRFHSDQTMGEYEAAVVINSVNNLEIPEDAARISINLIEKRIAAFDSTGLHIRDLTWPQA
jgi:hypothetical protein